MNTNLNDKDKAMDTAIRFQKRMRIPKFFFLILGITVVLAFIQDVITGSNFLQITIVQIIFAIYFSFGGIIILFYIIIAGICPYCHEFQKMNYGTSVGIGSDSFTFFCTTYIPTYNNLELVLLLVQFPHSYCRQA